jgi:hypothetical protein
VQLRACLELVVGICTTVPMHVHALGICTNPTSDKGCCIWAMVGSAMWLPHPGRCCYIAVEALQVSLQLYNPSTCAKHRYTHPAEALHSSTALYSVLQPLQLYIPYSIQSSTTPLCSRCSIYERYCPCVLEYLICLFTVPAFLPSHRQQLAQITAKSAV